LSEALYVQRAGRRYRRAVGTLAGDIYGGEVAEIKGEMSIKVLRRCSSELKLNVVLTLPSHQEIVFTVHQPSPPRLSMSPAL
jgi:hypothetical protein